VLIEKHKAVGTETSSRNSEVIHAGIYYGHDSLKTKLCLEGKRMMYEKCEANNIGYSNCGKWVVAQDDVQFKEIEKVHSFASSIGVPIRYVGKEEHQRRNPEVRAEAGILESPTTGIIDSHGFMQYLLGSFEDAGGDTALASPVTRIEPPSATCSDWKIWTASPGSTPPTASSPTPQISDNEDNYITAETVINSAGLYACAINNMILPPSRARQPFFAKGTYYSYTGPKLNISTLVYPAPVPGHAGLGSHLTFDLAGQYRFGPDVAWVDSPSDLAPTPDARKMKDAIQDIQSYLPSIDMSQITLDYAGIRPKLGKLGAVASGKGFQDFYIKVEEGFPGFVNLLGIESPGLTSSLAIGEYVHDLLYGSSKI